jgi:hypothetical protein
MKRVFIYITIVVLSGTMSCKKYLAVQPDSYFDEAYVFGSVGDATKAVLAVYNRLTGDYGYGGRLNYYFSNDTDETLGTVSSSTGGGDNANKAIARYNATASNTQLEPVYNQLYQGIERANNCIKNIPVMDLYNNGTNAQKAELRRLYGESLTLRAQFYFDLVKHWGDIPAPFQPAADLPDLSLPKTDRDTIYDHIIEDLRMAEALVPWRGDAGVAVDERITKGAVKGLRARLALHRGGYSLRLSGLMERRSDYLTYYTIARDECRDIMGSGKHQLNASFEAVFKDNLLAHKIETNGEVLFEVALAGGVGLTDGKIGNIDGIRVNGKGQGSIFMIPTYFYSFDSLDVRRDVTIAAYQIDASGNKTAFANSAGMGILLAKFRRDWITNPAVPATSDASYHGVNWPLIRYSDILLMYAEAENELNELLPQAAIDAFKQVRKRGFNGDETKIGTIPTDKINFFKAIVKERAFELGGEAVRKYDLIRWNLINETFATMKANLALMRSGAAPYNKLPQRMYYKNASPNFIWYGSYYQPAVSTVPTGYTAVNWTLGIPASFVTMVAEMFKPNHSELLPLPQSAITSNKKLKQDYGY